MPRAQLCDLRRGACHHVLVAIGAGGRVEDRPQAERSCGAASGMLALKSSLIDGECVAWELGYPIAHALRAGAVTQSRRIKTSGRFGCGLLGDKRNADRDNPQR